MSSIKRVSASFSISTIILALIIITCAIPKEIGIIYFSANIERPYGSTISISMQMILMLLLIVLNSGKVKRPKSFHKQPLIAYLAWGIVSGVFIFINSAAISYYLVAAWRFLVYILLFYIIAGSMSKEKVSKGIDLGFKVGMILQTVTGVAYVFFGILIPFVGNYSTTIRNGLSRMVGSFAHPGDFSLYISILTVYFVAKWLFTKDKTSLIYALFGAMDILLSGARAMLIATALAVFVILLRKNRKNALYKVGIAVVGIVGVVWFVRSDTFQNLFLRMSFLDMFQARFIHWIIGIRIMFANAVNFFFGVGLNAHVDYIDAHFSNFYGLVATSKVLNSEFARGMPIHNSFLIAGSELGILGLVLYVRVYVQNIRKSIQAIKTNPEIKMESVFILSAFFVYAVYAMQGWAIQKNFGMIMLVILCAYSYHSFSTAETPKKD